MILPKTYPINQCLLYKLQSRDKLARGVFGVKPVFLERLANSPSNFHTRNGTYGGKNRDIALPKPAVEQIHRRLFVLLARVEKPGYLHSDKGRSHVSNARSHAGAVPLVQIDIRKFYPSIDFARVFRFFRDVMQCSQDVAAILAKLTTFEGRVPIGSCVSQQIAFFAAKPLYDELAQVAVDRNVRFTCFIDNLTFSGANATPAFLWKVKQVIHSHGLSYHDDHCYTAEQRKLVTGVLLDGGRIAVKPEHKHEIWRQMRTLNLGDGDVVERIAAIDKLVGKVAAAGQIEPHILNQLKRLRAARADLARTRDRVPRLMLT